jgi:hypothetical protein
MKISCLTIFVLLITSSLTCFAQEKSIESGKKQIGISYSSFGSNDMVYFQELEGAPSYNGEGFFTIGLLYLHPLCSKIDLESGIEYSHHQISISPNVPPGFDDTPSTAFMSLVTIPVIARVNLLKYFFINGGLFLDIDAGTTEQLSSQTGIGGLMGIGINYDFDCRVSVFVNPYLKAHSLLQFPKSDYHNRLMETGFRFGLAYNL